MHLIFGGAYQGKLDYAKERYGLQENEIFHCGGSGETSARAGEGQPSIGYEEGPPSIDCEAGQPSIDFTKRAVNGLEEFVLQCVRGGVEARDYLEANREKWGDTVFLCTDISSGVVPMDAELRAWREMVGRTLMYLGKEAAEVTRIFCGLPQRIK